jgi:hypothetical protein
MQPFRWLLDVFMIACVLAAILMIGHVAEMAWSVPTAMIDKLP